MTTPYALFDHVPLSECRSLWRGWHDQAHQGLTSRDPVAAWREELLRRAIAAISASRDQLQDHLDGTVEAHKTDIRRYNEMAAQLAAVTAERDELRRELDTMTGEL